LRDKAWQVTTIDNPPFRIQNPIRERNIEEDQADSSWPIVGKK